MGRGRGVGGGRNTLCRFLVGSGGIVHLDPMSNFTLLFFRYKTCSFCQSERAHNANCVIRFKALISKLFVCPFDRRFHSLHRHPTITVYNRTECSSTSQTREPGTRIAHLGPKKLMILCDQARFTLIAGLCRRKWVRP